MPRWKAFPVAVLHPGNGLPFRGMLKYRGRSGGICKHQFFHTLNHDYRQKPRKQKRKKPPPFFHKNINQSHAEKPAFAQAGNQAKYFFRFGGIQRNDQEMRFRFAEKE